MSNLHIGQFNQSQTLNLLTNAASNLSVRYASSQLQQVQEIKIPSFVISEGNPQKNLIQYDKYYLFSCNVTRYATSDKTEIPKVVLIMSLRNNDNTQVQIVRRFVLPSIQYSIADGAAEKEFSTTLTCVISPNDTYSRIVFTTGTTTTTDIASAENNNIASLRGVKFSLNAKDYSLKSFNNLIPTVKTNDGTTPTRFKFININSLSEFWICINGEGMKVKNFVLDNFDIDFFGADIITGTTTITYYY